MDVKVLVHYEESFHVIIKGVDSKEEAEKIAERAVDTCAGVHLFDLLKDRDKFLKEDAEDREWMDTVHREVQIGESEVQS